MTPPAPPATPGRSGRACSGPGAPGGHPPPRALGPVLSGRRCQPGRGGRPGLGARDGGPLVRRTRRRRGARPDLPPGRAVDRAGGRGRGRPTVLGPGREDEAIAPGLRQRRRGGRPDHPVPLHRAEGVAASRSIARLRGRIPVEVATLRRSRPSSSPWGTPRASVPGRRGRVPVEEDRTEPDGRRRIPISCRLSGRRTPDCTMRVLRP